jgi:DNA-binding transcriptional LysR family regulator
MLDVGRLRTLLAVRQHRSVPAAARALSCSPNEVAEHLAALERQLGVTLVEGEPRALRLTPAGARLASRAEQAVAELERAEADVATLTGRPTGWLTVGSPPCAGQALLGDALARMRETAPEVEVRINELGPDEDLGRVLAGDLDVAVVGEYGLLPRRPEPGLDRRELAVEPVLLAVPGAHPVAGPAVRLAELAGERWIAGPVGSPSHELLRRAAGIAGFEPTVVGHCADELALALVAAGHGLALVSACAAGYPARIGADAGPPGVRLLTPLDPSLRRTLTAVARTSRAGDPAVVRMLDALAAAGRRFVDGTPGAARPAPADFGPVPAGLAPEGAGAGAGAATPGGTGPGAGAGAEPAAGFRNGRPGVLPPLGPSTPAGPNSVGPSPAGPSPAGGPGPVGPATRRRAAADTGARPGEPPNGFPLSADLGVRSLPPPDLPHVPPLPATPPARSPAGPGAVLPPPTGLGSPAAGPGVPPPAAGDLPRRRPGPAQPDPAGTDLPRRPRAVPPDPLTGELPRRTGPEPGETPGGRPPRRPAAASPASPAEFPSPSRRSRLESRGSADRRGDLGRPRDPDRLADTGRSGDLGRFGPLGTLPPAPPDEDVRLSIFEELQSEWFSQRAPGTRGTEQPPWDSPADDGWRAAARLAEPPTAGTTSAGLPRRMPQALYVPGAIAPGEAPPSAAPSRTARDVRGRLASYRDGVRRGRHAERQPGEQSDH